MALMTLQKERSTRVGEWLREPGIQVLRTDLLMIQHLIGKEDVDTLLENLDEDNVPIPKVTWHSAYERFVLLDAEEGALIQALTASGRQYIKVEVVGDPALKAKWFTEEESQETAPSEEEA